MKPGPKPYTPAQREAAFWEKVDKDQACWLWTGARSDTGYGTFKGQTGIALAHRWAYEALVGQIPAGLDLDHLCRNRICVNPAHLEPVTRRVNMLRGIAPSAIVVRTNRCKRGHEFTAENTYWRPDGGGRQCRECITIRWRRRKAAVV